MSAKSQGQQLLQGKRILVTALDLEQREHRGIAVYSKALIRHLRRMGAEVWLLTQFKPITSDLRQLPQETQRIIYSSRTLNELVHGKTLSQTRAAHHSSPNSGAIDAFAELKRFICQNIISIERAQL